MENQYEHQHGNGEYWFESDQVALKGNKDYHDVLSCMVQLEALRKKALADLDRLHELKNKALKDPLVFVNQLQNDPKSLDMPTRPSIPALPTIDWSKYSYSAEFPEITRNAHSTRGKKIHVPEVLIRNKTSKPVDTASSSSDVTLVRGRVKSTSKPETFNQLWTSEEQRKLEQLLIEFPPERVEARRYRKIADKLGTKTLQQVASRIQKYFIQLARSGLPVPGRTPNLSSLRRKVRRKHHLKNKALHQSTFLQAYVPPVFMPEDDDVASDTRSAPHSSLDSSSSESSDSDLDVPEDLKTSDEYKELMELKSLRQIKLSSGKYDHHGYKCDGCGQEPIQGTRYHCTECPDESSIDFCSSCNCRMITLGNHKPGHRMQATSCGINELPSSLSSSFTEHNDTGGESKSFINDKDYLPSKFNIPGNYNYLDPNYMPNND